MNLFGVGARAYIDTLHTVMHFPHLHINDQGTVLILQTVDESKIGHQRYFQRITDQDTRALCGDNIHQHALDLIFHMNLIIQPLQDQTPHQILFFRINHLGDLGGVSDGE